MDGRKGRRGVRPLVWFFNRGLPHYGRSASKSSITTTFITGRLAAGESLPPHFHFSTKAKERDRERIKIETVLYMKNNWGQFGTDLVQEWPPTIRMNEKGSMDDDEFEIYITNSIVLLFSDAKYIPGKRFIININSGPGWENIESLAKLRNLGFLIYPGVSNTTSVSQKNGSELWVFKTHIPEELGHAKFQSDFSNQSLQYPPMDRWSARFWEGGFCVWMCSRIIFC